MGKREKKKPKSELKVTIQVICAIISSTAAIIELILKFLKG